MHCDFIIIICSRNKVPAFQYHISLTKIHKILVFFAEKHVNTNLTVFSRYLAKKIKHGQNVKCYNFVYRKISNLIFSQNAYHSILKTIISRFTQKKKHKKSKM